MKSGLVAVDLFCGAGGLSTGLQEAGLIVVGGVEIDSAYGETFEANHPYATLIEKDIRDVTAKEIKELTYGKKLHFLAGCPPCQGFSQLTEKHKRNDPRNQLPLQMGRLVTELEPDMVMMENVPGLARKGKLVLDKLIKLMESKGYIVNYKVVCLADYGIPQTRRRLVLLAGKGFEIQIPEPTHSKNPSSGQKKWKTLKNALGRLRKDPVTVSHALENGGPQAFNWHVVRDLKDITKERLKHLGEGSSRQDLPEHLRPNCHKGNKGFTNVYGRLAWDETPPTITRGCTTISMGRFGHPTELRALSVREAAAIQTFPASFKFKTDVIEKASIMVGNALPPKFAQIMSEACIKAYKKNRK